jgi:FtsX-like permease family protein
VTGLGLRLALGGGREAATRLLLIAAAVALGTGLLLISLAGINAVNTQNARYGWLDTTPAPAAGISGPVRVRGAARPAPDPLWWLLSAGYFGNSTIARVDVAATGPRSPVPPGIGRLPGPGQFYASPALARLLRITPPAELGDRFPGRQVGIIGPAALPAPDSLVIVIGHTPAQLSRVPGAQRVTQIATVSPSGCGGTSCIAGAGINASGIDLVLSVVACALLFPVLIFIGTATRLSAARREERFAALRLVGATPRQVCVLSAVESAAAASTGVAAGFGLFFAVRRLVAAIPFTGAPFFPGDLSLNPADILLTAVGIPVAAAVVAGLALRRVRISPLGVSRQVTPRPPRPYRVIPLLAGIAELGYFAIAGPPQTTGGQTRAYLPGFVLILAGLVIAGPWLTMAGAAVMARRTRRPAGLIAARRLAGHPQAAFRAVSGLVLALFVTTVAVEVVTTVVANRDTPAGGPAARAVLIDQFSDAVRAQRQAIQPATAARRLGSLQGALGVAVIHTDPLGITIPATAVGMRKSFGSLPANLVSCAQLARFPALGRCPAGAVAAAVPTAAFAVAAPRAITWPAAAVTAQRLARLPVQAVAVRTNGSLAAVERARTELEAAFPHLGLPATIGEFRSRAARLTLEFQRLAEVVILASLPIAGCTLAVSMAAGLSDRKRPFSLLRLAGTPLAVLRRVIVLESTVPLLAVAAISVAAGFAAAWLFLRAQLGYALRPPGPGFYIAVGAGLIVSLGLIAATLPMLDRLTGPETARNE